MDDLLAGARKSREPKLDIDWDDFASTVVSEDAPAEVISAEERYVALATPLIPGFGGVAALRTIDIDTVRETMLQRIDATAEDVSDLHYEHEEYVHPHCPKCFPDTWRGQLARWFLRGGGDPLGIRPPAGGLAPGEGFYDIFEVLARGGPGMMIDGYLPDRAVGVMRGKGSAGKTFVAVDMALPVVAEQDVWRAPFTAESTRAGEVGVHGKVLFLAGESHRGVAQRFMAAAKHRGVDPEVLRDRVIIQPKLPDFFNGDAHLEALIERIHGDDDIRLVIVDTLQKAAAGADQNNASDMAKVHLNFARVRDAMSGGSVMVIAHTGKDNQSTRGSSSIEDDSDFVLHVSDDGAKRVLSVEKLRDGAPADDFEFVINTFDDSAVVVPMTGGYRRNEAEVLVVAGAFYRCHRAASWDDAITYAEVKSELKVEDMSDNRIRGGIAALMDDGRLVKTEDGKRIYRLTPQGRAWTEAQGLGTFM